MTTAFATTSPAAPSQIPRYPKGEGYGALVGDRWVRLAPNAEQPVRYYTKDSLAARSDDTGSVYENVLDIGYSFARGDLSGGEGLDWSPRFISQLDDQEVKDKIRYWDSENIDVARPVRGELARVTLSRRLEIWKTEAGVVDLATSDQYLFIAHGPTLEWWADWDDLAPTDTANTLSGLDIVRVEASGQGDAVVLLSDNTLEYLKFGDTVFTAVPVLVDVEAHWFAKGRFIAYINDGDDNSQLQEFDSEGVTTVGPFLTGRWQCLSVVSSGPAVVAALSDGTVRTFVPEQSNQIQEDSVSLVTRGVTDMPEGEIPYLLGSNADILLILTRTTGETADNDIRLYQSSVLDERFAYIVGGITLRREWRDTSVNINALKNMASTRDEIWFNIHENGTEQMTWRFDLVTFGLSRHITTTIGIAHSIVVFDERAGLVSGNDIWRTSDLYSSDGWLISPNITFGLNTAINFIALVVAAQNIISSGKQVELWYSTDPTAILDNEHPSWALGLRVSSEVQSEAEQFLIDVTDRQCALMLRLYSSQSDTVAPSVNNFAVRGLPKHRDWILELPVNVSDIIEVPGRRPVRIPGYGDVVHNAMMNKEGESIEVVVLDPPFAFRGIIDNIVEPTTYITDRGGVSVRVVLQCRGSRALTTTFPTGDAGLGLGLLGVVQLGIGQTIGT